MQGIYHRIWTAKMSVEMGKKEDILSALTTFPPKDSKITNRFLQILIN